MNDNVFALIVGIENYDQDKRWQIVGPCTNAVGIVDWLLSIDVPPANLFVFLDPARDMEARVAELQRVGVHVVLDARSHRIDEFWRDELPKGRPAGSRLMVYWSGHGYADHQGNRIFLCREYKEATLSNRVFNGTNFLRYLRGANYQVYADQIFLADVCATHTNLKLNADMSDPGEPVSTTRQTAYYATPEGVYAKGTDDRGVFTNIVLSVLGKLGCWPEHHAFDAAMEQGFRHVKQTPFVISHALNGHGEITKRVGLVPLDPGNSLFNSVYSLLAAIDVADDVLLPHYRRTVTSLGEPALASADGLSGMVRQLASLRDTATPQQVPYGMIEFLLRLTQEAALRAPIEDWLGEHAVAQANNLANARKTIVVEKESKILLVDVTHDDKGEISAFEPLVRTYDLRPVPGIEFGRREVRTWEEFSVKFRDVLAELRKRYFITDFQIQFAVDSPLFDRLFHAIEIGEDRTLGEEYVVVLRYGPRLRSVRKSERDEWLKYANALRPLKPPQVTLLRVPSATGKGILPLQKGLCYFHGVVSPAVESTLGNIEDKRMLKRLLDLGVPYLYWLHSLPQAHDWKEIEVSFTEWLRDLSSLDEFPDAFKRQRLNQDPFASSASLLWDDPESNPFLMNLGACLK